MAKLPVVRDHMDKHVPTLRPETKILDAVGFLLEKKVTGAPVVDKSGRLVGMVSARDALGPELEGFVYELLRQEQIEEVLA